MTKQKIGKREMKRLLSLNAFENAAREQGFQIIAGVDEAGRGPLAGPVVAAACIIPEGVYLKGANDSKQLSKEAREEIYQNILQNDQILYGVGIVDSEQIDKINIFQATIVAMLQAVDNLSLKPHYLLVDGLKLPHFSIPTQKIIKGDAKSQSIAAASIIAKVTRDRLMMEYHEQWPEYGFDQHKGYGTPKHHEALTVYGVLPIHRKSFEPVKSLIPKIELQLELFQS